MLIEPLRSRRRAASLIVLAGLAASAAEAAEPLPAQDALCTDPAGPATPFVEPLELTRWLLATYPVRDAALDANGDGDTLLAEKLLAIAAPDYCTARATGCQPEDAAALAEIRGVLQTLIETANGSGYRLERLRAPSEEERADVPYLGVAPPGRTQEVSYGQLLDRTGRFVRITCVAPAPAPDPELETAAVEPPEPKPQGYWQVPRDGEGFRLTGDIDDLNKDRTKLGAVRAAEFNINSDLRDSTTAYQIRAVAGYDFEIMGGDDVRTSLIPFVQVERFFDGENDEIDKLGFGVQQAAIVTWPDMMRSEFALTPVYLTDSEFESAIGQLKFRWTPAFTQNEPIPLGFPKFYGPFSLQLGTDMLADAGVVFDPGDNANLGDDDNFARVGARVTLAARGAPGTLFEQIELELADKYLYSVNSQFNHINRFDAGLSYIFPGSDNYKISFVYSNGRDEDTLELFEFWKSQVGVRF